MWLFGRNIDLLTLFMPVWLCWLVLFCLPIEIIQADIPLWVWVIFVLCIDVGHVWSTIFRTYLDKEEFRQHQLLLIAAPIGSFLIVAGLAWYSVFWFWRCLAYLAVFHFIKQQYGFLALYKSKAKDWSNKKILNDKAILYWLTLYPVLYWHLATDLSFSWFVVDDFVPIGHFVALDTSFLLFLNIAYWLILLAWLVEEVYTSKQVLWGKILWVITTAVNWYGGIVFFNSDLVFTISNVVAHGVPYLALIIYYQHKKRQLKSSQKSSPYYWIGIILPIVFLLAWVEEYCWDRWVYGERPDFFGTVLPYTYSILENPLIQSIVIALLTLPQMTHYIIDGFIWKNTPKNPYIKSIFK